jgi:hypothetical protein
MLLHLLNYLSTTASTTRLHRLYINLAVCRDYSVRCRSACCPVALALLQIHRALRQLAPGRIGSTSIVPFTATTCLPTATALPQPRHTSGCLGSSRGSSSTTSPTPRIRVPQHIAWLVTRSVVDYFAYAARPGASSRHTARRRLLRPHRASGCLGTSRDSSRGSSSTTSPTPRVRVSRHVARLVTRTVINYFTHAARPGASARRAARHAARRRLLRLRRASGCLGTSRSSSSTTCLLAARLLVGRLYWLSPCARSLRLAALLLCVPPLEFSHTVYRDYLSRSNTDSTSSTPRIAATSSFGRIASTTHLD